MCGRIVGSILSMLAVRSSLSSRVPNLSVEPSPCRLLSGVGTVMSGSSDAQMSHGAAFVRTFRTCSPNSGVKLSREFRQRSHASWRRNWGRENGRVLSRDSFFSPVVAHAHRTAMTISTESQRPLIAFPGGGIYFWWQAGAVKALQQNCELDEYSMAGASAGSLSAVMAACDVDMDKAFMVASRLADENGVWTRKEGLAGIWGPMIYKWLDECLPSNAAEICHERVAVSVCHLRPSLVPLKRKAYDRFASKKEVIEACMASVHIPLFLDGKVTREFRGESYVDGSFTFVLRNTPWHVKRGEQQPALLVHHRLDEELMGKQWGFLDTISPDAFQEMFELGEACMTRMIQQGDLFLPVNTSAASSGSANELLT